MIIACASVDADGDLHETSDLVRERTGSADAWDPETSEEIIQVAIEDMLSDGLTVDESVRVALLKNPALQSSYEDVGIRKAELVAAGLPSNPFFSVSARFAEGGGPMNVTASVSQSLLDLFLIPGRKRAGQARLSMARWQVVREAVQLAGMVESEAFDLIALQRGRVVAEEGLALAQHFSDVAEQRLQAGLGDAVDVALASTAALATRRELLIIDRDITIRRAKIHELLGLTQAESEWRVVDELPAPRPPEDVEGLVEWALTRRLDIEVAKLRVAAARGDLDVEETRRVSDLSLGIDAERAESPPSLAGPMLSGEIPLWSRNEPAIAREEFLLKKAQDELRRTRNEVAREVREAAASLEGACSLVALFESEILPKARDSVETSQLAWQAGERDIIVVLESQRFFLEQRRVYVAAIRDASRARAALEVALGGSARAEQEAAEPAAGDAER